MGHNKRNRRDPRYVGFSFSNNRNIGNPANWGLGRNTPGILSRASMAYSDGIDKNCIGIKVSARVDRFIKDVLRSAESGAAGGVIIGYVENGIWYAEEIVDGGVFLPDHRCEFDYDTDCVKRAAHELGYDPETAVIGVWRLHGDSDPRFSERELDSLAKLTNVSLNGMIAIVVNTDPTIRIIPRYISKTGQIIGIPAAPDKRRVDDEVMADPSRLPYGWEYTAVSQNSDCIHTVFSDRAWRAVTSEVTAMDPNETGGLLLGHYMNRIWYVTDVIPAGPKGRHARGTFEYDVEYVNYEAKKLASLYRHPPTILGVWHRHPGSLDMFSETDIGSIDSMCGTSRFGMLSLLVNVDPELRLTMYFCSKQKKMFKVPVSIGDRYVFEEFLELRDVTEYTLAGSGSALRVKEVARFDPALFPHVKAPEDDSVPEEETGTDCAAADPEISPEPAFVAASEETPEADDDLTCGILSEYGETEAVPLSDEELAEIEEFLGQNNGERPAPYNEIAVPTELAADEEYAGPIYGYVREDSGYHIILGWEGSPCNPVLNVSEIGAIGTEVESGIHGYREDGKLRFEYCSNGEKTPLRASEYILTQNIFSRNAGLLESEYLSDKCAMICGAGSVGSVMAEMFARAGVGRFILCDTDVVEVHNISRHLCDLTSVGTYKVDAVRDSILRINPNAEVRVFRRRVQNIRLEEISDWVRPGYGVIFTGCDVLEANAYACDVAEELKVPCLSTMFFSMAWGLEMYYYVPQMGDVPLRQGMAEALRAEKLREMEAMERGDYAAAGHFYAGQEDLQKFSFQPGTGADVKYGCCIAVKLGLDLLHLYKKDYTMRLLTSLHQHTIYVLNRAPGLGGGEIVEMFENKPFQFWTEPVEGSYVYSSIQAKKDTAEDAAAEEEPASAEDAVEIAEESASAEIAEDPVTDETAEDAPASEAAASAE